MSSFNSPKYVLCATIIEEEVAKGGDMSTLRKRCIERFQAEINMSKAGASTYYSNLHKAKKVEVPVAIRERQVYDKDAFDQSIDSFSMVTVDKAKRAVDVKVFVDKQKCLDECNKLNRHFIRGIQIIDAPLGTIRTKELEVSDDLVDRIIEGW